MKGPENVPLFVYQIPLFESIIFWKCKKKFFCCQMQSIIYFAQYRNWCPDDDSLIPENTGTFWIFYRNKLRLIQWMKQMNETRKIKSIIK